MRRYLLLVLVLVCAAPGWAASRVECGQVKSALLRGTVDFCALLPASYDPAKSKTYPVIYMLHGLGDSSRTLITTGVWNLVDDLVAEKKLGDMVIITPEGGRSFYVNSRDGRVRYEDFFIREFIPAMEKKFRISRSRAGRAISGISMGGYGALRFAFKYPQMFASASAHMPALLEHMPSGASAAGLTAFMGNAFGHPLDAAFWDRNTPFVFARTANLRGLKIYFDCGDRDDYGFDAGATQLHKLLETRKVPHEYHIYPGGHDWQFVAAHFTASLEFDWKVLSAK